MNSSPRQQQYLSLVNGFLSGNLAAPKFCAQFTALWTQDRDSTDAKKSAWPQPYDELLLAAWQTGKIGESEFRKEWAKLWGYAEETKFQDMVNTMRSTCMMYESIPESSWQIDEAQLRRDIQASLEHYESVTQPVARRLTSGCIENMTKPNYLLLLCLLLLPAVCWAQADPEASQEGTAVAPAFSAPPVVAAPTVPQVHSKYAVLVDVATGKVLWGRNENTPREIASTTKIMTAILLMERGRLTDQVVGPPGIQSLPESSLHIRTGERIPLKDLLYAMLLRSANDTAVAGADYLCGSVPAFAAQMNLKAREIGTTHTHFVTPNGLYAPDHHSTAADLARIASYAVTHLPLFNTIVKTQKYKITRSVDTKDVWVRNTATSFLKFFPGADGIKTGYIHQAGHCFVGSATRTDAQGRPWRMIAVALNSPSCREDVMSLLNYGFANFQTVPAVAKDAPVGTVNISGAASPVPVVAKDDLRAVVSRWRAAPQFQTRVAPLPHVPPAPVAAGTRLGTVAVYAEGKLQATGDALAARDVPVSSAVSLARTGRRIGHTVLKVLVGLAAAAVLLIGGIIIYARTIARQKRRRLRAAARPAQQNKRPQSGLHPARASAKVARAGRHRLPPDV